VEQELGPFGRSFLGEFPTRGTLAMSLFSVLLSFMLAGGLFSSLFLSIVTTFLMVYLCYNVVEPHFNAGETPRDFINDFDVLPSGLNDKMKQAYKHSGMVEIWDLSGELSLDSLFGGQIETSSPNISEWESESKVRTWMKISTLWIAIFIAMYAVTFMGIGIIIFLGVENVDLFFQTLGIVQFAFMGSILLLVIYFESKFEYLKSLFNFPKISKLRFGGLVVLVLVLDYILTRIYTGIYEALWPFPEIGDVGWFVDANSASDPLILFLLFTLLSICAPLVEELIFRGYILDSIRGNHSDNLAIIGSGIMFGFMHWDPIFGFFDLYQTGHAVIAGFLYAWLRLKTGSLWPCIICHAIWNGTIFLLMFVI